MRDVSPGATSRLPSIAGDVDMKIAIVGSGIAGNVAARALAREHEITVFEANDYVGGHTHTHEVEVDGTPYAVDTGFIVFNDWTYPNFTRLLSELGVAAKPSTMSFSVRCERSGVEYNGTSLNTLFAQRRNVLRPSFHRMLRDILRFNREARSLLDDPGCALTLGKYLERGGYGREFIEHYIIPMGAAIWSADPAQMYGFPAHFFVRFFDNHGMLSVNDRPRWYVVPGGSRSYVEPLIAPFRERIRLDCPVAEVRRLPECVAVRTRGGELEYFDFVFLACHSDQALALLGDATSLEREVLGAIPYQENDVVLHTDERLLPHRRRAWAAWNYHVLKSESRRVTVTYNMNILQGLDAPSTFCVTLNHAGAIDPRRVLKRIRYEHPVFTPRAVAAQARQRDVNGVNRTFFCGAYWRNGFHEDGVVSALDAVRHLKDRLVHDEQLHLRRAS